MKDFFSRPLLFTAKQRPFLKAKGNAERGVSSHCFKINRWEATINNLVIRKNQRAWLKIEPENDNPKASA